MRRGEALCHTVGTIRREIRVLFGPSAAILQAYDAQFGEENGQFVYRRFGKGEAYRITEDYFEELRAAYTRDYRRIYAAFMAGTVAILLASAAGIAILNVAPDGLGAYSVLAIILAALVALLMYANQRAVTAPARWLERDVPVALPLDPQEHRRRSLSRISYRQLLLAPVLGLVVLFSVSDDVDIWSGAGRLAWLVPAGFTALAAFQAWRKFNVERVAE